MWVVVERSVGRFVALNTCQLVPGKSRTEIGGDLSASQPHKPPFETPMKFGKLPTCAIVMDP